MRVGSARLQTLSVVLASLVMLAIGVAAGAAPPPAPAAAAATPLIGETLLCGLQGQCRDYDPTTGDVTNQSFSCAGLFPSVAGTFSATFGGTATGPYPGRFTETLTATINTAGGVTAFHASFAITSPTGAVIVNGAEDSAGAGTGSCDEIGDYGQYGTLGVLHAFPVAYQATISTANGDSQDAGIATIAARSANGSRVSPSSFVEIFGASAPVVISPATIPNGAVGVAYRQQLTAAGGTDAGYTFALTGGSLPTGLTLVGDTISGTPMAKGIATFTITATDDAGHTGSQSYTLSIGPAIPLPVRISA